MKHKRSFVTVRHRTTLGVGLVLLIACSLIAGVLLIPTFSGAAWALFGIALLLVLLFLVLIIQGAREVAPADRPEVHMEPSRLEALISLFTSLENRPKTPTPEESCHLVEQTEEEYQKEQAEWLTKVKRKQEDKKGKPPADMD